MKTKTRILRALFWTSLCVGTFAYFIGNIHLLLIAIISFFGSFAIGLLLTPND